jgi:hypothetical protein
MRTTPVWFSPARRLLDLDLPSDEPSHIHIARPSRLLRRDDNPHASGEPSEQVRLELDATDLTPRAA